MYYPFSLFLYRMDKTNANTEVDFLDDRTPLSTALIDLPIQPPEAYVDIPSGSFIIISSVLCFKKFEIRFLNGVGDANISRTLGQIRDNTVFRDLCTIVWDNSDATSFDTKKKNFFLLSKLTLYRCSLSLHYNGSERIRIHAMQIQLSTCASTYTKRGNNKC